MVSRQTDRPDRQASKESQSPRERAIKAYDQVPRKAAGAIEEAPLLALAGGLAAGAVLASLIPASRREQELLGPVAGRIKDRAGEAVTAAKDAGQARLDELGLTRDKGTETLRSILEGAGDAARASADAAVASIRSPQD